MTSVRLAALSLVLITADVFGQSLPPADSRAKLVKDLNTPRTFPDLRSAAEWRQRAEAIRANTLVSLGLWPLPERSPLNPRISPPELHDGVAIHRVFIETHSGFFLGGTLYTPAKLPAGQKLPAVLNPHGHGKFGRLHDDDAFSNPARCIQFARMGMVAFSYDMAGYQDTMQLGAHRTFLLKPELQLWNINLMGLQTWNSIRALDFVQSLPFVDPKRVACTGESGGGTQTFMLGAVDDRLLAQAPICMVSHSMQGGCQCENAPGLRVEYSSMDLAAVPAPRRQLLVAATGDWTKATMTVEGPALEKVYRLLGAREKLHYEIHTFPHNYNQTSREAVYAWFNHWLIGSKFTPVKELKHTQLPDAVVRVFPNGKMPREAVNEEQFIQARTREAEAQFSALLPKNRAGLETFRKVQTVAWRHNLQVEIPSEVIVEKSAPSALGTVVSTQLAFGRSGKSDRLPGVLMEPVSKRKSSLVILVGPAGKGAFLDAAAQPVGLAAAMLAKGQRVLLFDTFRTGELGLDAVTNRNYFDKFFTAYNRTDLQERVQDLLTATVLARRQLGAKHVVLCGTGRAGLWTLLAAPAADAVVADADGLDSADDKVLLAQDLFAPGLRKMGGFAGVAALAAPHPTLVHNHGGNFSAEPLVKTFAALKEPGKLRLEKQPLANAELVEWVGKVTR